jgi:hypothetical protein
MEPPGIGRRLFSHLRGAAQTRTGWRRYLAARRESAGIGGLRMEACEWNTPIMSASAVPRCRRSNGAIIAAT